MARVIVAVVDPENCPWQNPLSAADVNADHRVAALDALVLITNLMNLPGHSDRRHRIRSEDFDTLALVEDDMLSSDDLLQTIDAIACR